MMEDEDWQDLQPLKLSRLANVTVTVGADLCATLFFRRAAATALGECEAVRIQVGGAKANKLRLVADDQAGSFSIGRNKGTLVIRLGKVSVWPGEVRQTTAARWSDTIVSGLVLELPNDFAVASVQPAAKTSNAAHKALIAAAPAQQKLSASMPRQIIRRPAGEAYDFGDPPRGRSALDQRKGARA